MWHVWLQKVFSFSLSTLLYCRIVNGGNYHFNKHQFERSQTFRPFAVLLQISKIASIILKIWLHVD